MRPEQWQSVKDKIESLLEADAAELPAYLDQIAGNDYELRRELESLLFSKEKMADDFLDVPVYSRQEPLSPASSVVGKRLGAYQIVAEIGHGGMGEVYRALRVDDQYQKEVAIKLIRAGRESAFVVARFRHERQILAKLEHPNIARLLDGGTTLESVPYLVMELIEGESITEYCDRHALGVVARLELFRQVCSAVQFAHQRLIIHRDIKPGNILVTSEGTPKLLDFGISKILGTETESRGGETATILRMLTPAYASPEQVKGEPITTASDIYSLGVVLYELLTGRHPYRSGGNSEQMLREICESELEKPSTAVKMAAERTTSAASDSSSTAPMMTGEKLSKRLRGDVDNIVLMALRKEPQRRYASAEQFGEDIRRYLNNLPVIARKDTATYRASKFVVRHKAGVAATAIVLLVFLMAFVVTVREARIARQQAVLAREQHARAERRFNDVRKMANSLIFEIHDSIQNLPGATRARELLTKRALEYLDSLSQESADPVLQRELATAYERIGDVQGNNTQANLTDLSGASASYAKAVAIRESLVAANPNDLSLRGDLVRSYFRTFPILEGIGDFDNELRALEKARSLASTLPAGITFDRQQFAMSGIYYFTARALEKEGDFSGSLENYQQATSLMEPIAAAPESGMIPRFYLAGDYIGTGKVLADLGRTNEAAPTAMKGLRTQRVLSEANPTNATLREELANNYDFCAQLLEITGDLEGALRLLRNQKKIFNELTSADPGNRMAVEDAAWTNLDMAEILLRQGKIADALPLIRQALSAFQKTNPANKYWYSVQMGQSYLDLGKVSAALGQRADSRSDKRRYWSDAKSWYQKALDARSLGPGQRDLDGKDQIGDIRRELTRATAALSRLRD